MQWFNTQGDTGFLRIRQNFEQTIKHCGSCVLESLSIGRAGDDYQYWRAEHCGLLDCKAVVCNAFAPFLGGGCREPPSTAQTRELQAFVANHYRCLRRVAIE